MGRFALLACCTWLGCAGKIAGGNNDGELAKDLASFFLMLAPDEGFAGAGGAERFVSRGRNIRPRSLVDPRASAEPSPERARQSTRRASLMWSGLGIASSWLAGAAVADDQATEIAELRKQLEQIQLQKQLDELRKRKELEEARKQQEALELSKQQDALELSRKLEELKKRKELEDLRKQLADASAAQQSSAPVTPAPAPQPDPSELSRQLEELKKRKQLEDLRKQLADASAAQQSSAPVTPAPAPQPDPSELSRQLEELKKRKQLEDLRKQMAEMQAAKNSQELAQSASNAPAAAATAPQQEAFDLRKQLGDLYKRKEQEANELAGLKREAADARLSAIREDRIESSAEIDRAGEQSDSKMIASAQIDSQSDVDSFVASAMAKPPPSPESLRGAPDGDAPSLFDFDVNFRKEPREIKQFIGRLNIVVNVKLNDPVTANQMGGMRRLHDKYKDQGLHVLAFPSNQGPPEPIKDDKIRLAFKEKYNFGKFPSAVVFDKIDFMGADADPIFTYLEQTMPNPWGLDRITYNYEKWLVDSAGRPLRRYPREYPTTAMEQDIDAYFAGKELPPTTLAFEDLWEKDRKAARMSAYSYKYGINYWMDGDNRRFMGQKRLVR